MKLINTFLAITVMLSASAQTITIELENIPYDIIEWKGMGALLMSKDPNGATSQINISLVGDDDQTIWDQKIFPRDDKFYYLTSENTNYVYFLDNLELQNGVSFFSQLNTMGVVKNSKVNLAPSMKRGGYDPTEVILKNIVATEGALIYQFRWNNKKEKTFKEFAIFVAHHNQKCFLVEIGEMSYDHLKNEENGYWQFIGFTGNDIYFAAREEKEKKAGWSIKEFSHLGKIKSTTYLNAPTDLLPIENVGFGTNGSYYMENDPEMEKGLISQIGGHFYMMGGQRSDNSAELSLYIWEQAEWKKLNSMKLNYFLEKKSLELGIYPLNEGIGYHLNHNGYNKVSIIYFDKKEAPPHNDFTKKTIFNPSSVSVKKEKGEFVVLLNNGKTLNFDLSQLGETKSMIFEVKE